MKQILPIIMNTSFERLAVIDDYTSFIWTTRYNTSGDFELCVAVNAANMSLFKQDYYVVRDDDENVGIIEDIKIQYNEEGGSMMIVSGRFLDSILARRIIGTQTTVTGKISDCINALITQNIIDPAIAARQIANFTLGTYDFNTQIKAQYTGKNLLDTISDLCITYGLGFKVTLDDNNNFVFQLYQGVNRTYEQNVNPWVIFSDKYDNLMSSEYEENYQELVTAVLVAGEGQGIDRTTLWVTDGQTGLNRHEMYKDQRNIQSNDGEIDPDEYNSLLEEEGKECLTKYTSAFAGTVFFDSIKYKEDVNVGDLCVIENTQWGIYIYSRLVEVIESIDEAGDYSLIPTFGV